MLTNGHRDTRLERKCSFEYAHSEPCLASDATGAQLAIPELEMPLGQCVESATDEGFAHVGKRDRVHAAQRLRVAVATKGLFYIQKCILILILFYKTIESVSVKYKRRSFDDLSPIPT